MAGPAPDRLKRQRQFNSRAVLIAAVYTALIIFVQLGADYQENNHNRNKHEQDCSLRKRWLLSCARVGKSWNLADRQRKETYK